MGGLLVRAYIQGESYHNDIDKFAMVGTPNHGSLIAYYNWEGGNPVQADEVQENTTDRFGSYFYSHVSNNIYRAMEGKEMIFWGPLGFTWRISKPEARDFFLNNVRALKQLMPTYEGCLQGGDPPAS